MKNLSSNRINDNQALLAFSYFQKIGPVNMRLLENYFSSIASAYLANSFYLEKAGLKPNLTTEFIKWRETFDLAAAENELTKENISFITWHNPEYPTLLKEIPTPPFILYYKGLKEAFSDKNKNRLAVVGSRKHSAYAEKVIVEFMPDLINQGVEIISGLALGVDSLAHQAAVDNNGITIAVLGTGVDSASIYPAINRRLASEIVNKGGLIISEFPPKTQPLRQNFPQRNRIISGLCQATLVVEAKEKSGSLITANYALDQNREVLATPGNIFAEFSGGTNNLIKIGAKTITKVEEILEVFGLETDEQEKGKKQTKQKIIFKTEEEKIIYDILKQSNERAEKITADEITRISKLDTSVINSTLSILELRGVAKSDGISYDIN